MDENKIMTTVKLAWTLYERIFFRFTFFFIGIQLLPIDSGFFDALGSLFTGNWYYGEFFKLVNYSPSFFDVKQGLNDWIIIIILSIMGTFIWSIKDKSTETYENLYYWIRTATRYKLALVAITFGFIKIFPLQAPFPSLSILNTPYGEFTHWKLFFISLGAAPIYQVFLGLVEVVAGVFLLYRKTSSVGALILFFFSGNIFLANLAYEGGDVFYSLYVNVLALFIFALDAKRFYTLFFLRKQTQPNQYKPYVFVERLAILRIVLKSLAFVFALVFIFKVSEGYANSPHRTPSIKSLPSLAGFYNVEDFIVNGDTIPYSNTHPTRWHNVVFEGWNTVSIRNNKKEIPFSILTEADAFKKGNLYESSGSIGRHYYEYQYNDKNELLSLVNKNPNHSEDRLKLHIKKNKEKNLQLIGINEEGDSISVLLKKIDKKYLLIEGRKKEPLKL